MHAMKTLLTLLPLALLATASPYPQIDLSPAVNGTASEFSGATVGLHYYADKNLEKNLEIDEKTCEGRTEIALMKWRGRCKKSIHAVVDMDCWSRAPKLNRCCPIPKHRSCHNFMPKAGEWEQCLNWRKVCGPDCDWRKQPKGVRWCWKYASDI